MALGRSFAVLLAVAMPAGAAVTALPSRAAATIHFSQPAEGSSLHEGETVQIRWSGVPADAEEIELLLSVDGGEHFSLRLTDELDSSSGSFLWRVPSLLTDTASLAIRLGAHGREIVSAPGPLFRLSHGPSTPSVLLRWKAGEIWVDSRDADETQPGSAESPEGLSAHTETIRSVPGGSDVVSLPRFGAQPATVAQQSLRRTHRDMGKPAPSGSPRRLPLSIPQRI